MGENMSIPLTSDIIDSVRPVHTGAVQTTDRPCWPPQAGTTNITTTRIARKLINGGGSIRFVYAGMGKVTTGEDPLANNFHVKTGVEFPLGTIKPVTFNGKRSTVVMPDGLVYSDLIGVSGAVGDTFYERTAMSPPMSPVLGAATTSTTGGTLAAATYYYAFTAITDGEGESAVSNETSVTTTGTTSVNTIVFADQNMQHVSVRRYNVYRGTASGSKALIGSLSDEQRVFVDTGVVQTPAATTISATATTRQPSLTTTAGMKAGDTLYVNAVAVGTIIQVNSATQVTIDNNVSVTSGQSATIAKSPPASSPTIPNNIQLYNGLFVNEGTRSGLDLAHSDNGFSFIAATTGGYVAVAVMSYPTKSVAQAAAIAIFGDSIINGTGWTAPDLRGRGFATIGLNGGFPYLNLSCGGETAASFSTLNHSACRLALAESCKYGIYAYGTNDLATSTAAQIKSYILTATRRIIATGVKKVFVCPILPRSGSTNGWQDYVNQTASAYEAIRLPVNQYLRAPASAGAGNSLLYDLGSLSTNCGLFDTGALIERNSDGSLITINPATGAISNGSGGYWTVFGTTQYDTNAGTISGTTSTIVDSAKSWTTNQWCGYMVAVTTSSVTTYAEIGSNTATTLTINGTIPAPNSGSTYYLYKSPTMDGIHPTDFGHLLISPAIAVGQLT